MSFDLADLRALPAPASWHATHWDCDPEHEDEFHYRLTISGPRPPAQLAAF
ncbi:hypothetical protein [Streptomyces hydrogenans]|uniref:hypothetical protein n=1 Tax=Streptomyces hydrogenans TaxID=1873719 RepID=UPI0037F5629A